MANQHPAVPAARLAEEWGGRLTTIARNLTDFNESDAARRVLSRVRDHGYDGRTLAEATAAASALESLWQDYLVLSAVVEKARDLSKKNGFLSNRDEAVAALLQGPSVGLPTVSVPVGRRNLLDPADHLETATPNDVLMSMKVAFAMARDAIADVARAEDEMAPWLATIRARRKDLEAWRTCTRVEVEIPAEPDLDGVTRDPLTAANALASAESALALAEVERAKADRILARFDTDFFKAQAALELLRAIDRETADATTEAASIHSGTPTAPITDEVSGLADWLATLRRTASAGRLAAAAVGLAKCNETLALAKARAEAALASARAPIAELADLRGRFRALRAKGSVVRSATATRLEAETKAELARVPVQLEVARRLVAAYEKALARPGPALTDGETP